MRNAVSKFVPYTVAGVVTRQEIERSPNDIPRQLKAQLFYERTSP